MEQQKILLRFIKCISSQDVEGLYSLMADDHIFIDNIGNALQGKEIMKEGWKSYYAMFPDYRIEVKEILQDKNNFLLCGTASGTFHGNKKASFHIPAAWKAVIEINKVKLWQVFADTKAQFDAMGK